MVKTRKKRAKKATKAVKTAISVRPPDNSDPFADFVPEREYVRGEYFTPFEGANYRYDYDKLLWEAQYALPNTPEGVAERLKIYQWYTLNDLFFCIHFAMDCPFINRPWLVDRCAEVESDNYMSLDLWFREGFKTTIITIGETIQYALKYPEDAQAIFSHCVGAARNILRAIKTHLESKKLISWFPLILWEDTSKAKSWGLESGLTVKRASARREATIEAAGIVEGLPTGNHYNRRIIDDLVDPDGVTTPEQIRKTREGYQQSHNLGSSTVLGARDLRRVVGTPYSWADLYAELEKEARYNVRKYTVYGETVSEYTAGRDGVLLNAKQIENKLLDQGPYCFNCFPAEAPILMADWIEKPISKIRPGDEIVGWTMEKGKKAKLVRSKVKNLQIQEGELIKAKFASGREVVCTPDHKWYTGRRDDGHKSYSSLGLNKMKLSALISVCPSHSIPDTLLEREAAAYLGGIFDGEGCTGGGGIRICQSETHNPEVCSRIRYCLGVLGFEYAEYTAEKRGLDMIIFYIKGGRKATVRFLRLCNPAKTKGVLRNLFAQGTRGFGKAARDKLISIEPCGKSVVYNIETETHNYVAYGYATKNCQQLMNPTPENQQKVHADWIQYYQITPARSSMNVYIVGDPANTKKSAEHHDPDFTSIWVFGACARGFRYLLDGAYGRFSLVERWAELKRFVMKWEPKTVGWERYGKDTEPDTMRLWMDEQNFRFDLVDLGGPMNKVDRINKWLIPQIFKKKWLLPTAIWVTNKDTNQKINLVDTLVNQQVLPWPLVGHDDLFDNWSRAEDPELGVEEPFESQSMSKWQENAALAEMGKQYAEVPGL